MLNSSIAIANVRVVEISSSYAREDSLFFSQYSPYKWLHVKNCWFKLISSFANSNHGMNALVEDSYFDISLAI
jgi:hypothetical protein